MCEKKLDNPKKVTKMCIVVYKSSSPKVLWCVETTKSLLVVVGIKTAVPCCKFLGGRGLKVSTPFFIAQNI
jgi:hypothetical protein